MLWNLTIWLGKIISVYFFILSSVDLRTKLELEAMVERMKSASLHTINLTDNDLVKDHLRHLVTIFLNLFFFFFGWKWDIKTSSIVGSCWSFELWNILFIQLDLYMVVFPIFNFLDIKPFFAARVNHLYLHFSFTYRKGWEVHYRNFTFRLNVVGNWICITCMSSQSYTEFLLK